MNHYLGAEFLRSRPYGGVVKHMRLKISAGLVLLVFVFVPISLFAQAVEINPYAGWYWSGTNASGPGRFFNTQILGVRGGGYITHNFELGANWAGNNHFQPASSNGASSLAGALGFPQGKVRSNLWEAEFTYNFAKRNWFGGTL